MTPDLIIFDCDGVLIDSELIACGADADELTRLGYETTVADVIRRFAGVPSDAMYAEVEREFGRPLPPDFDARIERRVLQRYREDLNAIGLVEQTVAALPWRYCVASSSRPHKLSLGLIETGLYDLFYPHIFSATQVRRGKPAPDLFLFAAHKMAVAGRPLRGDRGQRCRRDGGQSGQYACAGIRRRLALPARAWPRPAGRGRRAGLRQLRHAAGCCARPWRAANVTAILLVDPSPDLQSF